MSSVLHIAAVVGLTAALLTACSDATAKPAACGTTESTRDGSVGHIVIREGDISCDDARSVMNGYFAMPVDDDHLGHTVIGDWQCIADSGATVREGISALCTRSDAEVVAMTQPWRSDARPTDLVLYTDPSTVNTYRFLSTDGRWGCVMFPSAVVCTGELPDDAPPNAKAVQVRPDSPAEFITSDQLGTDSPAADFLGARDLGSGRALATADFACSAMSEGEITCETRDSAHGFELSPEHARTW